MNDFIAKPIDMNVLQPQLAKWLGREQGSERGG
jgi:hypothetical protein